jgi:serine/threonine protein kinase
MRDGFEQGRPLDNGRFTTVSPLNHGSFGMVLAARDTTTGEDVAIKCITKPSATENVTNCPVAIATDEQSEELAIHSRLAKHPNIVNLIHNFETDNHQYMVLELCNNGDLYEAIRVGKGPLETGHVRDFMLELVRAVEYLHANGVYHRDIKPENIFLTSGASMKLGDFGLATTDTWSTEFAVGSDRYMAPEQYDASVYGYGYSPAACDIWAIGIVLLNILFQRNPFATPSQKDVLFADFARDRQSLFDIFPNMSQDTYDVLIHSLALDPANRSLAAVKDALNDVVSFTIDDETLDDFCTEQNDAVPVIATAAREPLRTPSLSTALSPSAGGDSFPWAAALAKTPQKTSRQLSTIRDEDDLFPGAGSDWQYVDTDEASLSSNLDSGLGLSYKSAKSMNTMHSAASVPPKTSTSKISFVGSLPISFSRPKTSPYGGSSFSKSWSDLYDEEAEAVMEDVVPLEEAGMDIERVSTAKPSTPQLQSLKDDGRGSVTPRAGLVDIDANSRSATPLATAEDVMTAERPPLVKQKSTILDRWSALGNFRRARTEAAPAAAAPVTTSTTAPAVATPIKTNKYTGAFSNFAPFSSNKKPKTQWRQAGSGSPQRLRSNSFLDNDWRRRSSSSSRLVDNAAELDIEDQDVEWVVGNFDFQL